MHAGSDDQAPLPFFATRLGDAARRQGRHCPTMSEIPAYPGSQVMTTTGGASCTGGQSFSFNTGRGMERYLDNLYSNHRGTHPLSGSIVGSCSQQGWKSSSQQVAPNLGEVGASEVGELVGGIAVVGAHVALNAFHDAQQLTREVRAHVGLQPCLLRRRRAPRLGHCLRFVLDTFSLLSASYRLSAKRDGVLVVEASAWTPPVHAESEPLPHSALF